MNIKTYNKSLAEQARKALNFAFTKSDPTDDQTFYCNDTDFVKYRIIAMANIVTMYFFAIDLKVVWSYCGEHLKNKYYKYNKMTLKNVDHADALQIVFDQQSIEGYNKNFVSKQQVGVTTGKKKFDALFEYLSKKMASIKRHFFASPYQMMLQAIVANQANKDSKKLPNLTYNVRPGGNEKVWIAFQKNQFSVYFGVSFEDRSEQQLCKIFLSELLDAKKHVHNPPGISIHEFQFPITLIDSFPEQKSKKYSFANGITCITIYANLVKKPEAVASYLAGFRNYIYYHIQAQKCYLHSRQLRIINSIQTNLKQTKIQPFSVS